ncbi:MAG TPA: hypothetical protein VGM76_07325 [Lacipirellulaceae bacterium]|jgi:REP element-mobilizing transposase RayT
MIELFDPKQDYVVRQAQLPHWFQPGVTYFVTFRTADSMPASRLRLWHAQRDDWLRRHGIDPARSDWQARLRMMPGEAVPHAAFPHTACAGNGVAGTLRVSTLETEFHRKFTQEFMEYLDQGHGACLLRNSAAAAEVASALGHFDGDRYVLTDYVVMPNHVHVLVCLLGETELTAQCESWKKYSAGQINALSGRRGRFWQAESFDHLVRTPEHFDYFRQYIADNPRRAKLKAAEYLHWSRELK